MAEITQIEETQAARWAQEITLAKLANEAKVSNELLNRILSTATKDDTTDLLKDLRYAVTRGLDTATTSINKNRQTGDKELQAAMRDLKGSLGENLGGLTKSLIRDSDSFVSSLGRSFSSLGQQTTKLGTSMGGVAGKSVALTGAFGKLAGFIIGSAWPVMANLNQQFIELYSSGVNLNGGLSGLARASGEIGISTSDLTKNFVQFSSVVAALGSDRAVRLTKEFTKLNRETGTLGMTNEMATEALLEYSEMMRQTGTLRDMSDKQIIQRSKEYYTELNQIAQITGQNRREMMRTLRAQRETLDFQLLYRGLPKETKNSLDNALVQLQKFGPEASNAVKDTLVGLLSTGSTAFLEPGLRNALSQGGLLEEIQSMAALIKSGKKDIDLGPAMKNLTSKLQDPELFGSLRALARAPGPAGEMARKMVELAKGTDQYAKYLKDLENQAIKELGLTSESMKLESNRLRIKEQEKIIEERNLKNAEAKNKDYLIAQEALKAVSKELNSIYQSLLVDALYPLLPALQTLTSTVKSLIESFKKIGEWIGSIFRGGSKETTYKKDAAGNYQLDKEGNKIAEEVAPDGYTSAGMITALAGTYGAYRGLKWGAGKLAGRAATAIGGYGKMLLPGAGAALPAAPAAAAPLAAAIPPAAGLGSKALNMAKSGLKIGPLGGVVSGMSEYGESGNLAKSLLIGGTSLVGGILGGAGGSIAGPVGTVAGGVGGSMAGEAFGQWLYSKFGGKTTSTPANEVKEPAKLTPPPVTPTVDPATKNLQAASTAIAEKARAEAEAKIGNEPPMDPAVIARKTLEYYEMARAASQNMVDLLAQLNEKLGQLDETTRTQTSDLSRSFENVGNIFKGR
jgi:hypothetical protein